MLENPPLVVYLALFRTFFYTLLYYCSWKFSKIKFSPCECYNNISLY